MSTVKASDYSTDLQLTESPRFTAKGLAEYLGTARKFAPAIAASQMYLITLAR